LPRKRKGVNGWRRHVPDRGANKKSAPQSGAQAINDYGPGMKPGSASRVRQIVTGSRTYSPGANGVVVGFPEKEIDHVASPSEQYARRRND
jgi:hypothetical protein